MRFLCPSLVRVKGTKEPCWRTRWESLVSSFPHKRKSICSGLSATTFLDSSFIVHPPIHPSIPPGLLWNHGLVTGEKVDSQHVYTHTRACVCVRGTKIKEALKRPCGGTLEEPPRSHWHWKVMQSSSQGTCNKAIFYSGAQSEQRQAASWTLTWGNLVGNWAAARGSSHPGECMPAWHRSALSGKRSTMISGWDAHAPLPPPPVSWVPVLLYHAQQKPLGKSSNKIPSCASGRRFKWWKWVRAKDKYSLLAQRVQRPLLARKASPGIDFVPLCSTACQYRLNITHALTVSVAGRPMCLLCSQCISIAKEYNLWKPLPTKHARAAEPLRSGGHQLQN